MQRLSNPQLTVAEEDVLDADLQDQWVAVGRSPLQHTLNHTIEVSGIGLHTGQSVHVQLHPAPNNTGRYFVRTDLNTATSSSTVNLPTQTPGHTQGHIPAHIGALGTTRLSTELTHDGATIRTVEHLLAALAGMGVDNVRIEVDGPEIPLLDGSAQVWVDKIAETGCAVQTELRSSHTLEQPVVVQWNDAFVAAFPAEQVQFTYGIDFVNPVIGRQWHSCFLEDFIPEIALARTFGFADEVEKLRSSGLIKGGSLENALVCGPDGWLNPPLRYSNEPVRHKLLDLVGDISLLGNFPKAHIVAYKASHALHTQLVQRLSDLKS